MEEKERSLLWQSVARVGNREHAKSSDSNLWYLDLGQLEHLLVQTVVGESCFSGAPTYRAIPWSRGMNTQTSYHTL